MIKAHDGRVEIEGTGKTLFADYACISNALGDKLGCDKLFQCYLLGTEDYHHGDVIAVVQGKVEVTSDAKDCTLDLAMILNAILEVHGDNAEKIIKTAADIATIIKRDDQVDNIDQIGEEVVKLLKGVEDV